MLQIVTLVEFARYRFFQGTWEALGFQKGFHHLFFQRVGVSAVLWALVCVAVTTCLNYPEWSQVVS
jgi:hypothetical protein